MTKQMQKTQMPQKKQGWKLWLGLAIGAAIVGAGWLIWTQVQEPEIVEVEKIVEKEIIKEVPVPAEPLIHEVSPQRSEKEEIIDLFDDIVDWTIEDPASSPFFDTCDDGTAHNPSLNVAQLRFGPPQPGTQTHPDTTPGVDTIHQQVKSSLTQNGWSLCKSNPFQPPIRETYKKDNRLLQINVNKSQSVGNHIDIQFEYAD